MQRSEISTEWTLLQNQFDSYEKYSLIIKLSSIGFCSAVYLMGKESVFAFIILMTLWLQDAIWKTFQSRIEIRLLQLERLLVQATDTDDGISSAFQFNKQYLDNRPTAAGLVKEYLQQALRPTVAFPHILLLLLIGVMVYF